MLEMLVYTLDKTILGVYTLNNEQKCVVYTVDKQIWCTLENFLVYALDKLCICLCTHLINVVKKIWHTHWINLVSPHKAHNPPNPSGNETACSEASYVGFPSGTVQFLLVRSCAETGAHFCFQVLNQWSSVSPAGEMFRPLVKNERRRRNF